MNRMAAATLCAMLFLAQGCDKMRGAFAEKVDKIRNATDGNTFVGPVVQLTETDYESFVSQRGRLVVVSFSAEWCGPCRQLAPVLDRVSAEFGDAVRLGKLDVDTARGVALRKNVRGIPDVRFFRNGKQVHQFTGAQPEARVRELFMELIENAGSTEQKAESLVKRLLTPSPSEAEVAQEEQPPIRPMEKDWMPPGVERSQ